MQNIIFLFYRIAKMIIVKFVCIKPIDSKCKCELKNIINLKKRLIIYKIKKYFGTIMKLNIFFITFNGKNGKKILLNLTKKEMTKICC